MKRILILDIDSCAECPCLHQYDGGAWCVAKDTPMPINWMIFDEIPKDGCSLKPLPKEKDDNQPYFADEYALGWNACLDAITGDNE